MTLFERLIARELPCHVVYEDAHVFAFLDIAPLAPGHTLLVPKEPAATLDALSDASAAALGRVLPRLCRAVQQVSGAKAYNVLQNNGEDAHQAVPHVHFHVVPKPSPALGVQLHWHGESLGEADGAACARALRALLAGPDARPDDQAAG